MKLLKEILIHALGKETVQITISNNLDLDKLAEKKAIKALNKIQKIIDDDSLSDFMCIELIVCVFESYGISTDRHDF